MNKKLLPWLLLICALGLSTTAAFYSILGLSIVFSAVATPVIIMGSFLEASKIVIATYLHNQWSKTLLGLKIYLTLSLVILSFITSVGIYGLLSHGFNGNISRLEVNDSLIANLEVKKNRFIEIKSEKTLEQKTLTKDISNLRDALSTGTKMEYKDRETGEIIRSTSNSARKTFESQLNTTLESRQILNSQIDVLNDSITSLELRVLDKQADETLNGELGVVKYLSDTLDKPIKTIATWLILLLIFVFDPLAITLVIATNQAFKNLDVKKNIYGESKPIKPSTNASNNITITPNNIEITPLSPTPTKPFNIENEIQKINASGYSTKKRKQMINKVKDENSKTY